MPQGEARVGTSGFVYPHWKGAFYPEDLPQKRWFAHYATRFSTVEVNNTFYRLPSEDVVRAWRDQAPEGFVYAFKASRYLTHRKKLLPGGSHPDALRDFVERLLPLGDKLGPLLFQLPPQMRKDVPRLRAFLVRLPPRELRYVFEFRHPSWHDDEVYDLLGEHGVALCLHDWKDAPTPHDVVTARTVYVRFHGVEHPYAGWYTGRRLRAWVPRVSRWRAAGHDVYLYFNNDEAAYATRDAAWLARALGVARAPRQE